MKKLLLLLLFLPALLVAQDTTLVKKATIKDKGLDEQVNDVVQPITSFVEGWVFYSFKLKDDVEYYRTDFRMDTIPLETPHVDTIVNTTTVFDTTVVSEDSMTITPRQVENIVLKEHTEEYKKVPLQYYAADCPYELVVDASSDVSNMELNVQDKGGQSYLLQYGWEGKTGNVYSITNTYKYGETVSLVTGQDDAGQDKTYKFVINNKSNAAVAGNYKMKATEITLPFVLIWLIAGALFFTLFFKFVNFTKFKLAIDIVRGKYVNPAGGAGEVSPFQALTAALSATVGLGNIAGVAIAIALGGPGATFWMILAGLLGMSSKFAECTLGVKYREIGPDGTVYGGPMYYLSKGLKERGMGGIGKAFGIFFAIMCVGGSFGGGNMFQANQAAQMFNGMVGAESTAAGFGFGLVMAVFVGIVIIGGIKRIGSATEKIVPLMCGIYVVAALIIILMHISEIPAAFGKIFSGAFNPSAVAGGIVGVLIQGFRRAAFSNEAGVGSAAIAHSAVKTEYPASEGIVALLEPFIDTVVVCTMTALVIVITGNYVNPEGLEGVALTSKAFSSVLPGFSYILTIAVVLFAFSTMLSWSYYGLQAWMFLFGRSKLADYTYKFLFLIFIVLGASASLGAVVGFSDAMIFAMVFPNIIGVVLLSPVVKEELAKYLAAIKTWK